VITDNEGTGTILDADASTPTLTIDNVTLGEGASGQNVALFTVTLSARSSQAVTVQVATANGTAAATDDFDELPPTTLTFAPGEISKTVAVPIRGDGTFEETRRSSSS